MGSPQAHRCDSDTTCDSDMLPIDPLRPRFSDANSLGDSEYSQDAESSRSLFCLALVNPQTGTPQRIATPHEALAVSKAMAAEPVPCTSGSEDSEQPAADYDYVSSNPLCRIGGPCRHCGARGASSVAADAPARAFVSDLQGGGKQRAWLSDPLCNFPRAFDLAKALRS